MIDDNKNNDSKEELKTSSDKNDMDTQRTDENKDSKDKQVRLLAELRDKVSGFGVLSVKNSVGEVIDNSGPISDAVSALMNLGYGRAAAYGAVSHSAQELGEEITVENLVKAGLQELSA